MTALKPSCWRSRRAGGALSEMGPGSAGSPTQAWPMCLRSHPCIGWRLVYAPLFRLQPQAALDVPGPVGLADGAFQVSGLEATCFPEAWRARLLSFPVHLFPPCSLGEIVRRAPIWPHCVWNLQGSAGHDRNISEQQRARGPAKAR